VCEYAHERGVSVEGELGALAGLEEAGAHDGEARFTDPDQVVEFVERTGVDCLAISIGTSHGVVKIRRNPDGTLPELRFDLLARIERLLPSFPIVLHGASSLPDRYVDLINRYGGRLEDAQGIPEAQIVRLLPTAVCKINNASDGWIAATAAARRALAEAPGMVDPRGFLTPMRGEMKAVYMRKTTQVFMSAGRKIGGK
jgi:fructose-bisphosphate aldolase class II